MNSPQVSSERIVGNPVLEALALNENRFTQIEQRVNRISERLEAVIETNPELKRKFHEKTPTVKPAEAQALKPDLTLDFAKKVKPLADRLISYIQGLLGTAEAHGPVRKIADISEQAAKIIEFNQQSDHKDFCNFINETIDPNTHDIASYVPSNEEVMVSLLDTFIDKLFEKGSKPTEAEIQSFLQNIHTMLYADKLDPSTITFDMDDPELEDWGVSLEAFFDSEGQSFYEPITTTLAKEGFYEYSGLLLSLTYDSAKELAKNKGMEIKDALKSRFMYLRELADKYRPKLAEAQPGFVDLDAEAVKLVDEFLASDETDLVDFKSEETHLHELMEEDCNTVIEEMMAKLEGVTMGADHLLDTELDDQQPRDYSKEFTQLIRRALAVFTNENVSKAKATELYDWLGDERTEAKEERQGIKDALDFIDDLDLVESRERYLATLRKNPEKSLVVALENSLTFDQDMVNGLDQDKLAVIMDFRPD